MRLLKPCLLLCLLTPAAALHAAEVYKCVEASGKTTLTDVPCHTLPNKQPPRPADPARSPDTQRPTQPRPDPILPPAGQQLPSPAAPLPASPPAGPPVEPRTSPTQG